MTNILFCYWLQGYFEISIEPTLESHHIKQIQVKLSNINEPLWEHVEWLKNVCHFLEKMSYKQETLNYFLPLIQKSLNVNFYHYFDNNLDRDYTLEELERLHAGTTNDI